MKSIFEQGEFERFSTVRLDEARAAISESFEFSQAKTTIFISHKHDDLEDLKGLIGFLEHTYSVKVYIDSKDVSMPKITSGETATKIKDRITKCNKFILLATNGAIESKWCNWELGYGDAKKYQNNIALFPVKPKGDSDYNYKGSEYMSIYPHISYYYGDETYSDGNYIKRGYYVKTLANGTNYITPLADWLDKK